MPKLVELIDQESWDLVRDDLRERVLALLDIPAKGADPSSQGMKDRPGFRRQTPIDLGMPILQAIHRWMWSHSKPSDLPQWDRIYQGWMQDVVSKVLGGDLLSDPDDLRQFVASATRQLFALGVVAKRSKRSSTWYLRSWEKRREIDHFVTFTEQPLVIARDWREEKRIEEFADQPVRSYYRLPDVPLPDNPTLADLIAWAREVKEKWTAAFERVNRAYEDERRRVEELEAKLEQLRPLAADAEARQALEELTDIWSS